MKHVAIIQARMGSTRLPGKTLLPLVDRTVLEHIIIRTQAADAINQVVVATTSNAEDDPIAALTDKIGVKAYRGSQDDVLDRFYQAAKVAEADVICRVTADDPFKDHKVIDQIISKFNSGKYDYVSNTIKPTYPEGIDIEVLSFKALEKAWKDAKLPSEREHVTPYIWKNSELFSLFNVEYKENLSHLRWTLDNSKDWEFVQAVYKYLYTPGSIFLMDDILQLLQERPELAQINMGTVRNEGYLKSLSQEENNS